jgi:surface protein|tara:strand:- start:384 stop:857 length:474 start_codon:yes stop_codon:yes gene_type:complete
MPTLMGATSSGTFTTITTKAELQEAVREYNTNPDAASATYGSIAGWDVSMITDMTRVFYGTRNFNAEDISSWDTSKVTNMHQMFRESNFNADISSWDTSKVTNMYEMFFVRSSPCMPACAAAVPHALPLPGPHLAPHRMCMCPSLQLGSTRRRSTSR